MPRVTQQKQTLETRTEVTQSTHLEQRISVQLEVLQSSVHNLTMKLFGDTSVESAQGRLPRLEASTLDHDLRLETLERDRIKFGAFITAASCVISAAAWCVVHLIFHV